MIERRFRDGDAFIKRLRRKLPFTSYHSPCIVADPTTVGHVSLLDADGEVVVALEAERRGNDLSEAAPADYDKLAAHDPEEAIWVVGSRETMHDVLEALNEPARGAPRIEREASRNTSPPLALAEPGWTEVRLVVPLLEEVVG